MHRLNLYLHQFASKENDTEDLAFQKWLILVVALSCCICGLFWSAIYYSVFGFGLTMTLPLFFVAIIGCTIYISHHISDHRPLVHAQLICITFITTSIQWSIGSMDHSGLVISWSFLAPFGALIFLSYKQALVWIIIFLSVVVVSAVFEPKFWGYVLPVSNSTKALFYIMNLGAPFVVIFGGLWFFVKQKELALRLLKENSILERTNLEQELMLRRSEKLATLGQLSAGVAHELNNPASAVQRGAEQIRNTLSGFEQTQFLMGRSNFSAEQTATISNLQEKLLLNDPSMERMTSMERSDREYELESELNSLKIDDAWEYAPILVNMGFSLVDLKALKAQFSTESFSIAVKAMSHKFAAANLLDEIGQGANRISEIITALKSYTYMDQAPKQYVDIHEGLNNTLVMLRSKLKKGIEVHKEFDENLSNVCAFGSELNQVWTNLIDNAVYAMDGKGEIWIRTTEKDGWVSVEIRDNGPGIPEEVKSKIFDPFFTTKPQGDGTGLGLHICYNIITQKHNGEISVESNPGETKFHIRLPIN